MKVSIMITTRNRRHDLCRTLSVLEQLNPAADEILITSDGCSDGTVEMVREMYPKCILIVNEIGGGSVPARDNMVRKATGDIVLSLDDDSYPVNQDFVEHLRSLFAAHPEAAVICFPELCDDGFLHEGDPFYKVGHYVASYPNCAAAMRREVYLQATGFPPFFEHSYEEPDYAAQCAGLGYAVWFEPTLAVRHHYSPANRNWLRVHQFHARNELWSVWMRCPWPWLPFVSLFRIVRQFQYACSKGFYWTIREPLWWVSALSGLGKCLKYRKSIIWHHYLAWMRLARNPLIERNQWRETFE